MAELADALDLGSSVPDVKVQVLSGAPYPRNIRISMRMFLLYIFLYTFFTRIYLILGLHAPLLVGTDEHMYSM